MVLFFEILLVVAVVVITWFALIGYINDHYDRVRRYLGRVYLRALGRPRARLGLPWGRLGRALGQRA